MFLNPKRFFALFFALTATVCLVCWAAEEPGDFKVKEVGGRIEISSPYGVKIYSGDFDLEKAHNYKIEIPLKDFRPAGTPDPKDKDKALSERDPDGKAGDGKSDTGEPEKAKDDKKVAKAGADDTDENDDKTEEAKQPVKTPDIDPFADVSRLVVEANRFYNQGKYYEAMIHVDELTRKRPEYVRGWIMKGSLLYVQGQKDLAKEAWEKAKVLEPANPEIASYLSRYR